MLLTYLTAPKGGSRYSLRALLSRTISSFLRDIKSIKKNKESTTPEDGSRHSLRACCPELSHPCWEMSNCSTRTKIRLLLKMDVVIHWEPCCPELSHPCWECSGRWLSFFIESPGCLELYHPPFAEMSNCSTRTKIRLLLTMALVCNWEPCCPELSHPYWEIVTLITGVFKWLSAATIGDSS